MTFRHLSALPNKGMHILCVLYLHSFYCFFIRGLDRVGIECLVTAGDSLLELIEIPEFSYRPANKFLY
jgi:hypothetical protein